MTAIREFAADDYGQMVQINNQARPTEQYSEREWRYEDEKWDAAKHYKHRLVATDAGKVVGFGQVNHVLEQFHPDRYFIDVVIDPAYRRRGHGSALYDRLMADLRQRRATRARSWVKESEADSNRFALDRGFTEARREWQSRLDVAAFDPAPFAGATTRIAENDITITTLAAEKDRNPNLLADIYELDTICSRDVPDLEPFTPMPYELFLSHYIEAPYSIPEGFFIATHGGRYIGLARLFSSEEEPDILHQDLTGVLPEFRGKGVAMALKLQTVDFAREHRKREIRTWNDTMNRPMLRINEAMGFVKEPAEVLYVKELAGAAGATAG